MSKSSFLKRWNSWALPTRLTLAFALFGLAIALLELLEVPRRSVEWLWPTPPPPYDSALNDAVEALHRSNICLTSKLVKLHADENDPTSNINDSISACKIDLIALDVFADNYIGYVSQTPYSGAESVRNFTSILLEAAVVINEAQNIDDLLEAQREISLSLSEVGFWMCGMEWYLRMAPAGPGPDRTPFEGVNLKQTWDEWDRDYGSSFNASVRRRQVYQSDDPTNTCSGFIDLID